MVGSLRPQIFVRTEENHNLTQGGTSALSSKLQPCLRSPYPSEKTLRRRRFLVSITWKLVEVKSSTEHPFQIVSTWEKRTSFECLSGATVVAEGVEAKEGGAEEVAGVEAEAADRPVSITSSRRSPKRKAF